MAEKLERFRQIAQKLKDKVPLPQLTASNREKVDQLVAKISPGNKVVEIAEKFKQENLTQKVKELVSKYEQFTGVAEIMALQNTVIEAQERFLRSQERRRDLGKQLANIESRLKELHAEMQNTMKGDEKYLQLCTEEHKLIIQERALRGVFAEAEREEREQFASMSSAVKLGHERERAHAERNKYWYIVASIFGTVLGIAGSTINNRLKMAEFRDMMEQQLARSAGVLYSIAGGGGRGETADIAAAITTEFKYQAQLAENIRSMQDQIIQLVNKQNSVIDHMNHQEHVFATEIKDLKKLVIAASKSSAKSDAELAKVLSSVQQEMQTQEMEDLKKLYTPATPVTQPDKKVSSLDRNQVLTVVGIVFCAAVIVGNIFGRLS